MFRLHFLRPGPSFGNLTGSPTGEKDFVHHKWSVSPPSTKTAETFSCKLCSQSRSPREHQLHLCGCRTQRFGKRLKSSSQRQLLVNYIWEIQICCCNQRKWRVSSAVTRRVKTAFCQGRTGKSVSVFVRQVKWNSGEHSLRVWAWLSVCQRGFCSHFPQIFSSPLCTRTSGWVFCLFASLDKFVLRLEFCSPYTEKISLQWRPWCCEPKWAPLTDGLWNWCTFAANPRY